MNREDVVKMVGEELASRIDPETLRTCLSDTTSSEIRLTAEEVAVARALLYRVSGSALLNGDKKATVDAPILFRMVAAANGLLIGNINPEGEEA